MTKSIRFHDFVISPGKIDFKATKQTEGQPEQTDDLYFHLNRPIVPRNDLIALALSTLCGRSYAKVGIELSFSSKTLEEIRSFTNAEVTTAGIDESSTVPANKDGVALSFSGGFDSLAAYCIMPENTKLVSIDFGHWYQRETDFFQEFDTNIVSTNFRKLNYDRESWTFMGVGAILYSDYLNIGYNTFGTILEADPLLFCDNIEFQYLTSPIFQGIFENLTYMIRGLTEVGTILALNHYLPEKVMSSLASLASPGSEKRFRKNLLLDICCERRNLPSPLDEDCNQHPIRDRFLFGETFAIDFLSLYILKYRGMETVSRVMERMPPEALPLVESLSLSFYEKLNPSVLELIPEKFRADYLSKLAAAGITPYTEEDWREFRIIRDFLAEYNVELNAHLFKEHTKSWTIDARQMNDIRKAISMRERIFTQQKETLATRNNTVFRLERTIERRDEAIAKQKETLAVWDTTIIKQREALAAKDAAIAKQREALAAKDAAIAKQKEALAAKDAAIAKQKEALAAKDAAIAKQKEALAAKDAAIAKVRDKNKKLTAKQKTLQKKLRNTQKSFSYRLGRALTAPARWIRRLFKG